MIVSIHFPAEIEPALQRKAAAAGLDVATFVQHVVAKEVSEEPEPKPYRPRPDFKARLREIISRHAVSSGHVDDSRESIYAGRGE